MAFYLFDRRYSADTKIKKTVAILFMIAGGLILFSAIPQKTPSTLNLGFISLNLGTQLDVVRLLLGTGLAVLGYKMYNS